MWNPFDDVEREWPVIQAAPLLSLALIPLGAAAAWWFRGRNTASEIAGQKAQIEALEQSHPDPNRDWGFRHPPDLSFVGFRFIPEISHGVAQRSGVLAGFARPSTRR